MVLPLNEFPPPPFSSRAVTLASNSTSVICRPKILYQNIIRVIWKVQKLNHWRKRKTYLVCFVQPLSVSSPGRIQIPQRLKSTITKIFHRKTFIVCSGFWNTVLPFTSTSTVEILVSWSVAVPSSVSTRTSSSATELLPSPPPVSSRTVTRKSNASVVACKSAKKTWSKR